MIIVYVARINQTIKNFVVNMEHADVVTHLPFFIKDESLWLPN